ncbi:MAG: hypothetical protein HYV07_24905 [Deltaproteobacteria bacterium]|nr:hypothetical protein [Deltaproteobacteria bacterium]
MLPLLLVLAAEPIDVDRSGLPDLASTGSISDDLSELPLSDEDFALIEELGTSSIAAPTLPSFRLSRDWIEHLESLSARVEQAGFDVLSLRGRRGSAVAWTLDGLSIVSPLDSVQRTSFAALGDPSAVGDAKLELGSPRGTIALDSDRPRAGLRAGAAIVGRSADRSGGALVAVEGGNDDLRAILRGAYTAANDLRLGAGRLLPSSEKRSVASSRLVLLDESRPIDVMLGGDFVRVSDRGAPENSGGGTEDLMRGRAGLVLRVHRGLEGFVTLGWTGDRRDSSEAADQLELASELGRTFDSISIGLDLRGVTASAKLLEGASGLHGGSRRFAARGRAELEAGPLVLRTRVGAEAGEVNIAERSVALALSPLLELGVEARAFDPLVFGLEYARDHGLPTVADLAGTDVATAESSELARLWARLELGALALEADGFLGFHDDALLRGPTTVAHVELRGAHVRLKASPGRFRVVMHAEVVAAGDGVRELAARFSVAFLLSPVPDGECVEAFGRVASGVTREVSGSWAAFGARARLSLGAGFMASAEVRNALDAGLFEQPIDAPLTGLDFLAALAYTTP